MHIKSFALMTAAAAAILALPDAAGRSLAEAIDYAARPIAQANAGIQVDGTWVRASIGSNTVTAAYMTLRNLGQQPDRLLGASTPAAGRVELHTTINDAGVMQMRPVTAIDVAPGATTTLAPGGLHVMLLDLPRPLQSGSQLQLTLLFERAGTIVLSVPVRATGGAQ